MANPDTLRELQARLASQLEAAQAQDRGPAWLAVESGSTGLLLPLGDAGEIFPSHGCVAVPHTRPWFLGVANLRGQLHGVVDLGRFLGLAPEGAPGGAPADEGWLVALNPRLEAQTALRVDRLAGLRRADQLAVVAPATAAVPARPGFAGALFRDPAGRAWQEILLAELSADPHFLGIAASA
jgi:twitching motility protein PilI